MMKKRLFIFLLAVAAAVQCAAASYSRVSVHDPSIVIGYKKDGKITGVKADGAEKIYYIFGSHKTFAKSKDLMRWSTFNSNIQSQQNTLFAKEIEWSALGGSQGNAGGYNVSGNLWAPDVIWNKDMQKWCMYMSVNGDSWYSSIVLLTADSPEGNWAYGGTVIHSIPWKVSAANLAAHTDFYEVTGFAEGSVPARYKQNSNGNQIYGTNAIDPCVFYDEDGRLWMSYGSWFGGLWMIELDRQTGLRDRSHTYELKGGQATNAESDPYQGIKIFGGNHCSGEASYILYIGDRYYLFVTYGGLTANGGYNMRVFSSASPTGPYKDMMGHDARHLATSSLGSANCPGTVNGNVGTRLMSYYKWDWMEYAFCAQGHNSVVVDDDGRIFNVYHTRFNAGSEYHEVRVHQMFLSENGGLCTAPFEYSGETLPTEPLSREQIPGTYSVLIHNMGTDYANLKYVAEKEIELKEDGKVSGAMIGSWTLEGNRIAVTAGPITYKGYVLRQLKEGRNEEVICITGVGNDRSLWGYKKQDMAEQLSYPESEISICNADVFDICGRKVEHPHAPGVYIVNGRKMVRK